MRANAAVLAFAIAFAAQAASETVLLSLKPGAFLPNGGLRLGDLVRFDSESSACAKTLSAIPIPDDTAPGQTRLLDRDELNSLIGNARVDERCRVRWKGVFHITVRKRGVVFDIAATRIQISESLTSLLKRRYQDVEVVPVDQQNPLIEGSIDSRFEYSIPEDLKPQKRMMIVTRLVEKNGHTHSYPLWFSVAAYGDALVLTRDLAQGQTVTANQLRSIRADMAGVPSDVVTAVTDLDGLVVKTHLPAGAILRRSQFVDRPEIEAGERVSLRYRYRDVTIEASAVALQSSRSGQRVLVRAPVGQEVIAARTVGRGVAEVLP